ncbi:MAG: hypothetical protein FWG07_00920 [Treponema sp.]|nr:hypothetical protein [Treponema sp.]
MRTTNKMFGIIALVAVIGLSLVSCASLGSGSDSFIGSWTTYNEALSMGITYIIKGDRTYSVTATSQGNTRNNVETGTWARDSGSLISIDNNTTVTFTKSDGGKYIGRLESNKMIIGGDTYIKQETE